MLIILITLAIFAVVSTTMIMALAAAAKHPRPTVKPMQKIDRY